MSGLFAALEDRDAAPLADRLRPEALEEVVGQEHLLGGQGALTRMVESGHYYSLIFWGPPGCGKTTLARILARQSGHELVTISAVTSGVAELKKIFEQARARRQDGKHTLLFVDEIHRFNRSQQDAFLPVVEDGTIILMGATTENPSFELNAALLSRCKVLVLQRLQDAALEQLLGRAERDAGRTLPLTDDARHALRAMADGDGRYLLNMAEELLLQKPESRNQKPEREMKGGQQADPAMSPRSGSPSRVVAPEGAPSLNMARREAGQDERGQLMDTDALIAFIQRRAPVYDKHQESHYNLISALHKAVRGSDVQAALYWLARMLEGGENPLYITRRLVRMAVEDIGLAEPQALPHCIAAMQAYDFLGSPEGELALAQATIFLAMAPKSNAAYVAFKRAGKDAKEHGSLMPPKHILNAPTRLMKEEGYAEGYLYDPDQPDGFSGQDYFPESLGRQAYYRPVPRGFEREMQKRLEYWDKLRHQRQQARKESV